MSRVEAELSKSFQQDTGTSPRGDCHENCTLANAWERGRDAQGERWKSACFMWPEKQCSAEMLAEDLNETLCTFIFNMRSRLIRKGYSFSCVQVYEGVKKHLKMSKMNT